MIHYKHYANEISLDIQKWCEEHGCIIRCHEIPDEGNWRMYRIEILTDEDWLAFKLRFGI